jgi:hypothetical protein
MKAMCGILFSVLAGCSAIVPLGEQGRWGHVALECRWLAPMAWPDGRNGSDGSDEGGRR